MKQDVIKKRVVNKKSSFIVKRIYWNSLDINKLPRSHQVLRSRFNQNSICYAAFKNNEFAGFIWLCLNEYLEDEVKAHYVLTPKGSVAWDFDIFINPKYRMSTLYHRLWDEAFQFMRDRGVNYTLSRISAFNENSVKVHKKLGSNVIGWSLFFIVFNYQFMLSSFAPYIHLCLSNPPKIHFDINCL